MPRIGSAGGISALQHLLGLAFLLANVLLYREKLPDIRWAKRTFDLSVLYMSEMVAARVRRAVL